VVLVLDVSGQAQSAAAVAMGFARMRAGVTVAGVILNRVASPRHEALVRAGMTEAGITVFGALPRNTSITLPERHLGLVQAGESADLEARLAALAGFAADHLDLDAIHEAASATAPIATTPPRLPPPGQRIALAQDRAFSFVYPHLLAGWRAAGAEVLPFSPLADEAPPEEADCCWLPGGYPELHAGRIAGAGSFLNGLRAFARTRPVHGECGGFMVLGEALTDKEGNRHAMAGLLGHATSYAARKMHLGYRAAELVQPMPGLPAGTRLKGHEFHYSTLTSAADEPLATVTDANGVALPEGGGWRGMEGGGTVSGTWFHLIGAAT